MFAPSPARPRSPSSWARTLTTRTVFAAALALGAWLAACQSPIAIVNPGGGQGPGGAAPMPTTSGGPSSSGVGGGSGGNDGAGGGAAQQVAAGNYTSLCGGPNAPCVAGTDDCTLGGNPNMTGSGSGGSALSCELVVAGNRAVAQCALVGSFAINEPCMTASQCQAGLGCVTTASGGGICRPYCCGDVDACPSATYCTPVEMAESAAVKVPICFPASICQLLDATACPSGQTCAIVRDDGTTSCIRAGTGTLGQPCPCAAGYACDNVTAACLKLCHIGDDAADCGNGSCQGGVAGYPTGIGVCVGG